VPKQFAHFSHDLTTVNETHCNIHGLHYLYGMHNKYFYINKTHRMERQFLFQTLKNITQCWLLF